MKLRSAWTCAVVAACLACASARSSSRADPGAPTPEAILIRAIERAGGSTALERARALVWEGEATVRAGGRTVELTGRWAVQPPDTAVVATYETSRGPSSVRRLILSGTRGWMERGGQLTPMPPAMLANEREQFYLYSVMRLVPLRAPDVKLTAIPPDSLGQRGVRVTQSGRPDVELYVDEFGRLAHLRLTVTDAMTGRPAQEDVWLTGAIEADGVLWPSAMRITLDGKPYFDMDIRSLRTLPQLDDPLLAGPQ